MVEVKLYVQIVYKNHHIANVIIKKIVVRFQIKKNLKRLITRCNLFLYRILWNNLYYVAETLLHGRLYSWRARSFLGLTVFNSTISLRLKYNFFKYWISYLNGRWRFKNFFFICKVVLKNVCTITILSLTVILN